MWKILMSKITTITTTIIIIICRRTKSTIKHEGDCDTSCKLCTRSNSPFLGKRDWKERTSVETGQNTVKSSGDLKGLAVTRNPIRYHHLTFMWKSLKEITWIFSDSSAKQHHKDYVKARIDKMQQNSKCTLWFDRDKTINQIIKISVN